MDNIAGVPIVKDPPAWQSSSPTPDYHLNHIHPLIKEFKDYNFCTELDNLVRGKKIAYVAPSPHLKGLKMGAFIDSHDLVVRINQAYSVPEKDWEDYGKRTDMTMDCLNIFKRSALQKNTKFVNSLKFIVCPMINMSTTPAVNDFINRLSVPVHNVSDGYLLKLFEQVGTICNTGLAGIVALLNYEVESIYITGMSFYNMNTFGKVYNDTYHDEAAKNKNFIAKPNKDPSPRELRMDIHFQQPQIDYFRKLLEYNYPDRLKVDSYLIDNLNLKT